MIKAQSSTAPIIKLVIDDYLPDIESKFAALRDIFRKQGYNIQQLWSISVESSQDGLCCLRFKKCCKSVVADGSDVFNDIVPNIDISSAYIILEKDNRKIYIIFGLKDKNKEKKLLSIMKKKEEFTFKILAEELRKKLKNQKKIAAMVIEANKTGMAICSSVESGVFYAALPGKVDIQDVCSEFMAKIKKNELWLPVDIANWSDYSSSSDFTAWMDKDIAKLLSRGKITFIIFINITWLLNGIKREIKKRNLKYDEYTENSAIMEGIRVYSPRGSMVFYIQNIIRAVVFEASSMEGEISWRSRIFDII